MEPTKLLTGVIITVVLLQNGEQQQYVKPFDWSWDPWADEILIHHVLNLTELLVIDATLKLRHAEKIQEMHKHSITYELGTIAAGVLDHFKRMLKWYRKYSDEQSFYRKQYDTWSYMYTFHNICEYNEIRLEQGMFHDIVRKHEATKDQTTRFTIPKWFTIPPAGMRRFFRDMINNTHSMDSRSTRTTLGLRKLWGTPKKSLWKPSV